MKRALIFAYGVISYALFFGVFLYAIGFIGNFGVPRSIDGDPTLPLGTALLIDGALLALFAIQHSGMARPAFKRWLTRFIPEAAERSTYVLLSTACLALLMFYWAPLGGVIWQVGSRWAEISLISLYLGSWLLLLYATFLINHFDLFGLRQAYLHWRGVGYSHHPFATPGLYRVVRHPLYVGWIMTMWATPTMTVGHLLFSGATTLYVLYAIVLEERDLIHHFGATYERYRESVPMLLPRLSRRSAATR